MFSAAAKAARATGRAAKSTLKIAGEAAFETAKDAGLKTIKNGRGKIKQPSSGAGSGARSISGGSRRQRKAADMSERDEAIKIRTEMLRQKKKREQIEALQKLNKEKEEQRRKSAAEFFKL